MQNVVELKVVEVVIMKITVFLDATYWRNLLHPSL